MVESEANELPEEVMLGAVVFGHQQQQAVIELIHSLVEEGGKPLWDWKPPAKDEALIASVNGVAEAALREAYQLRSKQARQQRFKEIYAKVAAECIAADAAPGYANEVNNHVFELEAKIVREQILAGEPRIDGRDTRTVRPISIRTGVLPRTHGSALFTRGETQALVVATLGTARDEQIIDALMGEYRDRFMFHYNMPPYATGETGRVGSPKRREIGHGRLAKRALLAVLPSGEEFAYSLRVVSEITESNGSSSMASVCGASLALMDAGVPTKAHVAGIAMGLIKEGNRFAVLTDILGDEDHLGDMDFKVAGTDRGITALQMDIKIQGITKEIMAVALSQAREGRMHILSLMQEALPHARTEVSQHAPRMMTFKINPEKIRDVIGKGGGVIRALTEETGTTIDIQDDGTVTIASVNAEACNVARKRIEDITAEVEVGTIYEGTVLRLLDFGAIVQLLPGKDGLLHISQIAKERVNQVSDYLKEGQVVRVKVLEADEKGRVRLSMKAAAEDAAKRDRRGADGDHAGTVGGRDAEEGRPRAPFVFLGWNASRRHAAASLHCFGAGYPPRQLESIVEPGMKLNRLQTETMNPPATRIERDTFGPIEVPADRLWGAQTQRSLEHFRISGEKMPPSLIRALAAREAGRGAGQRRARQLPSRRREAIVAAADEVLAGRHDGEFPLAVWQTGSGTQTNMNVNEVLANRASRAARRPARRGAPRAPERRREPRPVVERRLSDRDARRRGRGDRAATLLPALRALRDDARGERRRRSRTS